MLRNMHDNEDIEWDSDSSNTSKREQSAYAQFPVRALLADLGVPGDSEVKRRHCQ